MRHRYLFIGGLHRSGTSLAARIAGTIPGMGTITHAPVPENEGVYLQGAIPHDARAGEPGAFAFDPAQHLVEGGPYDRLETRERIEADWAPWFPDGVPWRVEKSPVNLLRTRLYQQLFPLSQFVIVTRHPLAVARATAKWSARGEAELVAHWARAHEIALEDAGRLHARLILRYEDLVADPDAARRALAAFCDLAPDPGSGLATAPAEPVRDGNRDYDLSETAPLPEAVRAVMLRLGYGPHGAVGPLPGAAVAHPLRAVCEAVAAQWPPRRAEN
ncbi:sulfotransferase family protein [Limimaricola pyoseonensis]|uniref:Sulfotransferase family protein n=1 Tax=Limimaricola pyoseonensis TaxID=521013 RepID=A0A1G7J3M2_9RHOB|nr:sulfotransferase [Limimaricola pyoseonensis]SDF19520.1 Sulfotransferase family protein [Limimaricola pyoseonensis]